VYLFIKFREKKLKVENENLERKITERTLQLKNAFLEIEEKNKDIQDSIVYAKRIQEAILPAKELKHKLFPNAFVLYQPRDIVSGDFYWFTEKNGKRLIAAVDCTGHGVPGAFMSLIGSTILNEIVNVQGIIKPSQILNKLRDQIIHSLKQKDGNNKDGMDISLLCFNENENIVEFAAANNPLWIIRNNEVIEVKADKQPVGYSGFDLKDFTNHSLKLEKGDMVYLFSDGYADQFGGVKGKKYKYNTLKNFLISINHLSVAEQESKLLEEFSNWKGDLEQVDDVCIIGIKI
jgi:serine phosphatase RsbU (regulator of sigma subunit)